MKTFVFPHQINNISPVNSENAKILKDGSQVLVRIIADKGNGHFEGSVAGTRVNFQSSRQLKTGQTFIASISYKDGKILITPKESSIQSNPELEAREISSERLNFIISKLGLPVDEVSKHLFLQFTQLGMKLEPSLMQKIRNIGLKFGNKQKQAMELLALLKEKGIEVSQDELNELILELNLDERESGQGSNYQLPQHQNEEKKEDVQQFEMVNKVNAVKGKWYLLPFEIINSNSVVGTGNLRLMFENESLLKFMNIECKYNQKFFLFNVEFENKKCKKIRFNDGSLENAESLRKVRLLKEKLLLMNKDFENLDLEYCPYELLEGTACALEISKTVDGIL